jgi:hypothetical protein
VGSLTFFSSSSDIVAMVCSWRPQGIGTGMSIRAYLASSSIPLSWQVAVELGLKVFMYEFAG